MKPAIPRYSIVLAALPLFRQYDLGDMLHSSSDGQKFETRLPTINARYSPKYFGLHKGVVSYSLVANHVPVNWLRVLSIRLSSCGVWSNLILQRTSPFFP